jgi:uncharacterized damage-inducible protein DinB
MSEPARIADQLKRTHEGGAWHGPALLEVLSTVDAEQAAAHPIPDAHSIWEIVLHVTTWLDLVRRRVEGEDVGEISAAQDFPAVRGHGPEEWEDARTALSGAYRHLLEVAGALDDSDLERRPPGAESSVYVTLHGAVQHNLYHTGQIALLKRAAAGAARGRTP